MNPKTEVSSGIPDNEVRAASPEKQPEEVEEGGTTKKHSRGVSGPQVHPPPKKEYGYQWKWDAEAKDYTQVIGVIFRLFHYLLPSLTSSTISTGFTIVDKPKRFFQVGRIFAVVWFEPGGDNPPGRKADLEWTTECPKYHGEKPIAKYRWFVVVRKRLHHSLCFNITTIGPKGPRKADRGRSQDFVVLHNSNVEPSKPFEVEGITRDPIAVIIEAGEESISPWARLDCGRIYTVEDHLRVMKIGRIHTASLPLLETYFKESVS
ncbi:hypothetical protein QBC37DRAFT_328863 [Rhypophila decipiens]|uniref:DUF6590 domain-containing protein n=1 Tax=Rhypophila decipiens TaxID=261697 RepID=A0AAN7B1L0_9PEZI|nr:hypothetical protein QBC37DRAFT_328863 [Rhypophila decipiens]